MTSDEPRALPLAHRLLLVLLSGFLATLVFPPFGLSLFATLAWFPLLAALRGTGARIGFRLGLLAGLLTYAGTLVWLFEIFRWPALGLWLILACFVGLFGAWFSSRRATLTRKLQFAPLAAIVWTGLEYFRCEWFVLRFPWITPGTGLPPSHLSPLVGAYGGTFLIILGGVWLAGPALRAQVVGAITLAIVFTVAAIGTDAESIQQRSSTVVALVQCEDGVFDSYMDLTLTIDQPVAAIVWPEYALLHDVRKRPHQMKRIADLFPERARMLVLGTRTDRPEGGWHNTALTISADGVIGSHYKNRPVHFFDDGIAGSDIGAFDSPIGRIATPVCFDCDYTAVARRMVLDGASVIIAPSMDAEAWTERQHEQHAQLFRHRAAENNRWIAVAATSGVTQIIDSGGNVMMRLPNMEDGVLVGEVARQRNLTFYTRFGWLLGPLCVVGAAGLLLAALAGALRERRKSDSSGHED